MGRGESVRGKDGVREEQRRKDGSDRGSKRREREKEGG
jgi:hypothetical protein